MQRLGAQVVVAIALVSALLPAGAGAAGGSGVAPLVSPNAAFRWDRAALEAIKETGPGPTIAARALAVLHTCMFDAWAAYDPLAVGTRLGASLRRPAEERTAEAKEEAVSRAARLAAADLFPALAPRFDALLAGQGFDPAAPPTGGSPAGVARRACQAVLDFRHRDGSNQLGDEPGSSGGPYSDWTGYRSVNDPDHVNDPDRWQPLPVPDGKGGTTAQAFLTPQWGRVVPFAPRPREAEALDPGPPRVGTSARQTETEEMLRLSAGLSDEHKVIAEYWADGAGTEFPPGHWMLFGQFCSRRDAHGLDADVKLFFVLANAMLDASITAWDAKRRFDSVRPVTLVRRAYAGQRVMAWGGPYQGTREIDGSQWRPYIPTPPFPEYVSGHSTFSAAGAQVLRMLTGRGDFGATVRIPAGASRIEPGAVPAREVVLRWSTFDEAADQAGYARRLGGIHFLTGDLDGRLAGRRVAAQVVARAQEYFNGLT
jgi:hypothetical protein